MNPIIRWYVYLCVACYFLMPFLDEWIPEEGLI